MNDGALPNGFELTPDLIVGDMLHHKGLAMTYRCHDRALSTDVILYEYFPPGVAARNDDKSVGPKTSSNVETQPQLTSRPVLSLSSTVVVRGTPGGDTSSAGVFEWGLRVFMEEASLLAKLNHPSITRVFRAFRQNGTGYMTHQMVRGGTLADEVNVREFTQDDLDKLAEPLLDALTLLHSHGLIHRDVKPGNILIRADTGAPVLSDFGSATKPKDHFQTSRIFTPSYAPIEEYHDDQTIGPWTDIYGLAASLYYAILKVPPQTAMARMLHSGPSLESAVPKGKFRASFLRAIDDGLNVAPKARPQSIDAWRTQLFKRSRSARVPRRQIFISYRRSDTSAMSRRIYEHFSEVFESGRIFFDVDTIPAAVDFRSYVSECMDMTAVCVAVVGDRWRRNSMLARWSPWRSDIDHVHVEIGLALEASVPIVPVLIDDARMPTPKQLPKSIERFCYLNAFHLSRHTLASDLDRLTLLVSEHAK